MRQLDPNSGIPLHYQLQTILRSEAQHRLAQGSQEPFPSERVICETYNVSRATARRALATLEREGLLRRSPGRTTAVIKRKIEEWLGRLVPFSEVVRSSGATPDTKLLFRGEDQPPEPAGRLLGGIWAYRVDRLRVADGLPVAVEWAWYPMAYADLLSQAPLEGPVTICDLLEDQAHLPLDAAEQTIEAVPAPAAVAELLGMKAGDPVLRIIRVTTTLAQAVVEYRIIYYHGERYTYRVTLKRHRAN